MRSLLFKSARALNAVWSGLARWGPVCCGSASWGRVRQGEVRPNMRVGGSNPKTRFLGWGWVRCGVVRHGWVRFGTVWLGMVR